MKKLRQEMRLRALSSGVRIRYWINNMKDSKRGSVDVIALILFAAIVILAVIGTQSDVQGAFSDFIAKFRNWLDSKGDQVMT